MPVLTVAGCWLVVVFGVFLLCIVLLRAFFNPNRYRADCEAWLGPQTGRHFTLNGELAWQWGRTPAQANFAVNADQFNLNRYLPVQRQAR